MNIRALWVGSFSALFIGVAGCDRAPAPAPQTPEPPIEVTVLFDAKPALAPGASVMLRGFEVGTVNTIVLKHRVFVTVMLNAANRRDLRESAYGRVAGDGLELVVVDANSDAVIDGAVLEGANDGADEIRLQAELRSRKALSDAKTALKEALGESTEALARQARAAGDGVRAMAVDGAQRARVAAQEGAQEARRLAAEGAARAGVLATDGAAAAAAAKETAKKGAAAAYKHTRAALEDLWR